MANDRLRTQKLLSLGISYPFWVFDVDQAVWPRKVADTLPGSRPAKLVGWYPWAWEYGTDVRRFDDSLPTGVIYSRERKGLVPAQRLLEQLRYDPSFDAKGFRVVYEGNGLLSKGFDEWVFEEEAAGFVSARRVVKVERVWDGVPFWDRETGIDLFGKTGEKKDVAYGMASLVLNDKELVHATGVLSRADGSKIRRAEFELLDGDGEQIQGIVFPERHQKERGLYITRGPDFPSNRMVLAGTTLEGAPWSEVEKYVYGERS
ncbi:hypothetical protein M409DRAFT_23297 [Zasmidium cellare ATCC 36951]|uniref:MJ1316 RNA cyclic group end recognition domain-containing protein n=1 Tax=Zasmidium cellare ATCC 36951 TaxID=1080233 RepID=A0A6A6CMJ9_ZASCE|nr:uncharacterized protein M409DRAFT_23297 [Zasmidium cellare ATCC 36951]KAF2166666.1 hypothetical protein M409DRAFT_23297 [Zasmidium cellare ATCC 36951]